MKTTLVGMSVVLLAVSLMGCNSTPSCEEALGHIYDVGCAITSGGSQVSRADAITGCNTVMAQCNCGAQISDALKCLNKIASGQCNSCSTQMAAYNACATTNCKGSGS